MDYFEFNKSTEFVRALTTASGPEEARVGLVNWRNLHYFEYLPVKLSLRRMDMCESKKKITEEK
jgi:hypothetical protein